MRDGARTRGACELPSLTVSRYERPGWLVSAVDADIPLVQFWSLQLGDSERVNAA